MALSFSAVEAFYWASQLRSFNAAAEKLSITQPTVSYRIKELEEQLGVPLFIRQKRQLQLTSEGEALKHYAEAMIGIARDIESNIKTRNTRLPTLRVGVMDSFATVCLPALLDELDGRFAETRVAATVDTSHNLARQLSEGLLDIAVLSTPPSTTTLRWNSSAVRRWNGLPAPNLRCPANSSRTRCSCDNGYSRHPRHPISTP